MNVIRCRDKEHVVKNLLTSTQTTSNGPKVQIVGEEVAPDIQEPEKEGPTMMELMMAAQAEAAKAKNAQRAEEEKEMKTKPLGSGFKKGFFDSKPKKSAKNIPVSAPKQKSISSSAPSSQPTTSPDVPTIKKKEEKKSLVIDEVQSAMKEEGNPMLHALQKGGVYSVSTTL